jgi:hypothetical protein
MMTLTVIMTALMSTGVVTVTALAALLAMLLGPALVVAAALVRAAAMALMRATTKHIMYSSSRNSSVSSSTSNAQYTYWCCAVNAGCCGHVDGVCVPTHQLWQLMEPLEVICWFASGLKVRNFLRFRTTLR